MPPSSRPPRSKGCKQCIQRRVKCDGRYPCCKQCVRYGFACSGPIQGTIFLDMTEKITRGRRRSTPKRWREKQTSVRMPAENVFNNSSDSGSPSTHSSTESDLEINEITSWTLDEIGLTFSEEQLDEYQSLPILTHSIDTGVFEQCFIGQFVELVTSPRSTIACLRPRSWFFELPDIFLKADTLSLRYSIKAAALIYHAIAHRDKKAEIEALRLYSTGLECHRAMLESSRTAANDQRKSTLHSPLLPNIMDICIPLLFSYFEIMKATTAGAWAQHQTAAAKMLESRGPSHCQTGIGHTVFRSIRTTEAFKSILQNITSDFVSHDWCSIPFQANPKSLFDHLIDVLLMIPEKITLPRLDQADSLLDMISNLPVLNVSQLKTIKQEAVRLLSELEDWWWHFEQENPALTRPRTDLPYNDGLSAIPESVPLIYNETWSATSVATHSAANIILHSILLQLESLEPTSRGLSSVPRHQSCILSYSSSILHAAAYQNWNHRFCGDSMRTVFPLQVVSMLALEKTHQLRALKLIEEFGYHCEVLPSREVEPMG